MKTKFLWLGIAFFSALIMTGRVLSMQLYDMTKPDIDTLITNWRLTGNKSIATMSNSHVPSVLKGKNAIRVTYNLYGLCLLGGNASAIIFEQNNKQHAVSLSQYGKNCYDGEQSIDIPLVHFNGLDPSRKLDKVTASFWYPTHYSVTIKNAVAYHATSAVLGESTKPDYSQKRKIFPNITPIRPHPYAPKNLQE